MCVPHQYTYNTYTAACYRPGANVRSQDDTAETYSVLLHTEVVMRRFAPSLPSPRTPLRVSPLTHSYFSTIIPTQS